MEFQHIKSKRANLSGILVIFYSSDFTASKNNRSSKGYNHISKLLLSCIHKCCLKLYTAKERPYFNQRWG